MTPPPAPTITLYDRQGQPHAVAHDEAPALIASGQMGLPKGSTVPVVKGDTVGHVPIEQASAAFRDGARLASPEELHAAQMRAQYGGALGQTGAAVSGALSGATLGLSDEAATLIGGEGARQALEGMREANPTTSTISNVVGAIAPALFGDEAGLIGLAKEGEGALEGASAVARAVSAPSRAVTRAGSAIEHAVTGLIGVPGEGATMVSRLARHAIAKGAGAAVEGAVYGLANEVDEDVLGDHELNGEKLLAATGHGALLGLATGAGLSAAGEVGSAVLGRATPTLRHMAEEQAVRAIDPRKAFVRELDKIPGGVTGAGRRMLDDGVIGAGERLEDVAPKVAEARTKAGEKIGAILDAADSAGFEGPSVETIGDRVEKEVLADLKKMGNTNKGAIAKVRALVEDLENFAIGSSEAADIGIDREAMLSGARLKFRQMQDFRARLDDQIKWTTSPLAPVNEASEAMKSFRRILEDELEQSGEKAAKKMGGSFLDEYKGAKLAYRQYTVLDKAAQDALAAHAANRVISPTDYLAGMATMAHHGGRALAGAAFGGAAGSGEGEGGMIAGAATGALGALAHHAIRTRGNSTAALVLDKLSALRGVERAAQAVDRQVDRSVAGLLKQETHVPAEVRELPHPYRDHTEAIARASARPDEHEAAVARAVAPLGMHAPKVAAAFQSAAVRATQYLASQIPSRKPPSTITPQLDAPRVARSDEQKYMLAAQAVHDPSSVLADLAKGRGTRAQVEALKAVYPKLYAEVRDKLGAKLAERKSPLDYESRKQLSLLFGPAAGPMFDPKFGARMQDDFAAPATPAPGGKGHPKGGAAPKRKMGGLSDQLKMAG